MADEVNISTDMINNLVNILKNNKSENNNSINFEDIIKKISSNSASSTSSSQNANSNHSKQNTTSNSSSNTFNNLDFETIIKLKSIIETLNKKDDPDTHLLYSLKPYLRKSRQEKLEQYANILKISHISKLFN